MTGALPPAATGRLLITVSPVITWAHGGGGGAGSASCSVDKCSQLMVWIASAAGRGGHWRGRTRLIWILSQSETEKKGSDLFQSGGVSSVRGSGHSLDLLLRREGLD